MKADTKQFMKPLNLATQSIWPSEVTAWCKTCNQVTDHRLNDQEDYYCTKCGRVNK